MRAYYFGCKSKSETGHYLFTPGMSSLYRNVGLPFDYKYLDGLVPSHAPQSKGMLINVLTTQGNWGILTVADYSADSRPASNASFCFLYDNGSQLPMSVTEIKQLAEEHFPEQYKRITDAAPIGLL